MAELAKAELRELDAEMEHEINKDKWTKVQFNPDTLKVTYANQIQAPSGSGDQSGPQAQQFVGAGSTKLAVQLYFDVTQDLGQGLPDVIDVRKLTERVAYFIIPIGEPANRPTKYKPPMTRFAWGTFQFDGIVESMEETLELFSFEGRPLRAAVTMTITQQKITTFKFDKAAEPPGVPRRNRPAPGTQPQTAAPQGSNLQSMSAAQPGGGGAGGWQSVAAANGIENPRILAPGQLIDFQLKPPSPLE
ncbi:MAG TPA: peptidoglycan-binding protein [Thermoanaerobaculia bacterium]|nr:peptidoglycan-binding protein [Thermoanaerobaculia bacterium]